jgi:dephospho-CoA kinase
MTTRRIPIIGLVGGIGSGKSALAAAFESLGCRHLDADRLGHEILTRADVYAELVTTFGNSVLAPDGRIDRQRLAAVAFADEASTATLNRIVGPALWPEFRRRALEAADASFNPSPLGEGGPQGPGEGFRPTAAPSPTVAAYVSPRAVILDAALLFESETNDLCDAVVFVDAPEDLRRQRVLASHGWTWDEVLRRQARQIPLSRKRELADFFCTNDTDLDALRAAAQQILTEVSQRFSSPQGQNKCRSGPGPT